MKRSLAGLFSLIIIVSMIMSACQDSKPNAANESKPDNSYVKTSDKGRKVLLRYVNWVSAEMATRRKIDSLLDEFMRRNPDILVENIPVPFDQCPKQLVIMAESGDMPDVIQMTGYWTALLASQNVLEELDGFAQKNNYIYDSYSQSFVDAGRYKGKVYGIPFALTPLGFWYNKQLMKEAGINSLPQTTDELNSQLEIIKQKLGDKKVYGIGIDTTTIDYALTENWPYFWAFGANDLLVDTTNPDFMKPEILKALNWFAHVAKNGYTPIGMEIKLERQLMANNKLVYKLDGTYLKGILQDLNGGLDDGKFNDVFGVAEIPSEKGVIPYTVAEIHSLGISKTSANKEAAWKLITFLASDEYSIKNYIIPLGMIPPQRSSIQNNQRMLDSPHMRTFLNVIAPYAKSIPYSPKLGIAGEQVLKGLQEIFNGSDPEEVQKRVNTSLKKIYGK